VLETNLEEIDNNGMCWYSFCHPLGHGSSWPSTTPSAPRRILLALESDVPLDWVQSMDFGPKIMDAGKRDRKRGVTRRQ
jgi:hypothetical protein